MKPQESIRYKNQTYKTYLHTGPSMRPLLKTGDIILIQPIEPKKLKAGDIITYSNHQKKVVISHRLIKINKNQFITAGDNNPKIDDKNPSAQDILGKVYFVNRDHKIKKIYGGWPCLVFFNFFFLRNRLLKIIQIISHPIYFFLASINLFKCQTIFQKDIQIVHYQKRTKRFTLFFKRRLIGHYDASRNQWTLKRPYRLIISETYLNNLIKSIK